MNEVNNQFTISGTVVEGWISNMAGNYKAYDLWIETTSKWPQTLKVRFYERRDLDIDFRQDVSGCAAVVKGYIKSNLYTNKHGEKDIFINLVGCQFSLIDNIATQRDTPYVPKYNENYKPKNVKVEEVEEQPKVEKKSYKDYLPQKPTVEDHDEEEQPRSYIPKQQPKPTYEPEIPEGYEGDPDDLPF